MLEVQSSKATTAPLTKDKSDALHTQLTDTGGASDDQLVEDAGSGVIDWSTFQLQEVGAL